MYGGAFRSFADILVAQGGEIMDISQEISAIQEAARGSEIRQPIVDALNTLNGGTLPQVSAQDAKKILCVNSQGQWVASNEQYVPTPTGTLNISENGAYNVADKAQAIVNVQGGSSILVPKTITQNGTYNPASDNADGYSNVTVNVPGGGVLIQKNITQNGTYNASSDNADGYSSVNVNVLKFVEPLDYLENSHYYISHTSSSRAIEIYYGSPVETVASFLLEIGSNYIVALDDNPGDRFRRGLFDAQPFTVIPSPEPTGTDQVAIQEGLTVWNSWMNSSKITGNDPPANISFGFNATKRYLAVHLSLSGQTPNIYLVKLD